MKSLISQNARVVVGQRVHCALYGGNDGIVYEITGEQTPASVRSLARGVILCGGTSYFSIAFEDGHKSQSVPEAVVRGIQWRIYDEVATAAEITEALQYCEAETIRACTEEAIRTEKRAQRRLDAIAEYPHLERVKDGSYGSAVLGAKNIRIELKRAFPDIKFSVRSDGSAININWTLGPTTEAVEAITGKYQEGHFNGSEDIYESDRENVFPDLFGGARFVFENRSEGEALEVVAAALCEAWSLPLPADGKSFWNIRRPDDAYGHDIGVIARQILLTDSYPAGAVITGIEALPEHRDGVYGHASLYRATFTA